MQNNNFDWEHKKYLAPKPVWVVILLILVALIIFALYKVSKGEFRILPRGNPVQQL